MKFFHSFGNIAGRKGNLKHIPLFLASHAFLVMLAFILVDLVVAIMLWYQYTVVIQSAPLDMASQTAQFDTAAYQTVTNQWLKQQTDNQSNSQTPVTNPFIAQ